MRLAHDHGAVVRLGERVESLRPSADGSHVEIVTPTGTIAANHVVVSAGAWAAKLLGPALGQWLQPTRQVLHWFEVEPEAQALWQGGPVFIWPHGDEATDFFYGFPAIGGAVKTATENYAGTIDPDAVDRDAAEAEQRRMFDIHLASRLRGVSAKPVRSSVCLYTQTPDSAFVIDAHPQDERITVVSPCSGHGFKHSAAIGEAVSQRLLDRASRIDLSPFSFTRFT